MPPYEYLEDDVTSDVTFRAWGADLAEVFRAAVDATAGLMVPALDTIERAVTRRITLDAATPDLLLLRCLEEVIFRKDAEGVLLRVRTIDVGPGAGGFIAAANLTGEALDRRKHVLGVDVKAVTLYGLSVERTSDGWQARVTVDV